MSAASHRTCADRAPAWTRLEILSASALKDTRVALWWWKTAWVSTESPHSSTWGFRLCIPPHLHMIRFSNMQRRHAFMWNHFVCQDITEQFDVLNSSLIYPVKGTMSECSTARLKSIVTACQLLHVPPMGHNLWMRCLGLCARPGPHCWRRWCNLNEMKV